MRQIARQGNSAMKRKNAENYTEWVIGICGVPNANGKKRAPVLALNNYKKRRLWFFSN